MVKTVKALTGVDLLDSEAVLQLNVVQLVDVLYALCKEQCDKLGLSDIDFGQGFSGDTINTAIDSFREEYVSFFPNARTRKILGEALKKIKSAETIVLDRRNWNSIKRSNGQ